MAKEDNGERIDPHKASAAPTAPPRSWFSRAMTRRSWVLAAVFLVSVAAILALVLSRGSGSQAGRPVPAPMDMSAPSATAGSPGGTRSMPGDVPITLTPETLENARIMIESASAPGGITAPGAAGVRTTGTVQPNEYKQTPVFPIAGGIVRQVNAELGDRVGSGQTLVTILSSELADGQAEYLKMLADLEEHHNHHRRAGELVELGAISREEFEDARSKYKSAEASVASARQRIILLGMDPKSVDELKTSSQVSALISVSAPVSGTVINRGVNIGEVVEKGKELFRVADLSTVWVIAQIYEADFRSVRLGTPAVVTTPSYPGQSFKGRVSYIDPRVEPNSRTSQIRIEIPNSGMLLRLGMFVDVNWNGTAQTAHGAEPAVMVPRTAVQNIGSKQVVYLATDQPGGFVQREVIAGPEVNELIAIYSGVNPGDRVATQGSFLLRAESLKLNPSQATASSAQPAVQSPQPDQQQLSEGQVDAGIQTVRIVLTSDGYRPASIRLRKGVPARLVFVREVEVTCGTEVVIPDFDIKRELPLKKRVIVEFTPDKSGEFGFACGMDMVRGKIIVN